MLDQIIVVIVLSFVILSLIREFHRPGIILLTALFIFMASGVLEPAQAVSGFSNQGVLIIALLFMVSEGVKASGILKSISDPILPRSKKNTADFTYFFLTFLVGGAFATASLKVFENSTFNSLLLLS
jgi:di/tricarboxylate transporter